MGELVFAQDNNALTNSLLVAETFGKDHKSVLRAIDVLLKDENLGERKIALSSFFERTSYISSQNKELPMYMMTKDGFSILAMGFTGAKALEFKVKFIDAFHKMEDKLKSSFIAPTNLKEALLLAVKQQEEIEEKQKLIANQNLQIHEMTNAIESMQAKVSYVDKILASKSTIKTSVIAQDYGMSAKAFNLKLHSLGIQYRSGDNWILYAKYLNNGYVHSKAFTYTRSNGSTDVHYNMEWTQKGHLFLYEELKKNDILPLIERN